MLEVYDPNELTRIIGLKVKFSSTPVPGINLLAKENYEHDIDGNVIYWCAEPHLLEDTKKWKMFFEKQEPQAFILAHKFPALRSRIRVFCPFHFLFTVRANRKNIPVITSVSSKTYIADVLLGAPKAHRWIIFNLLKEYGLFDRCLISLLKNQFYNHLDFSRSATDTYPWGPVNIYQTPALMSLEDERVHEFKLREFPYFDSGLPMLSNGKYVGTYSQLIPTKIYENSWISIVAETCNEGDLFFPTEKTGKCLLAGRIFLVASSRHFLKNLRALGFETFSDVIDEGYDDVKDDDVRTHAMMESFAQLAKEDLAKVYQKVMPILQHNQSLMTKEYLGREARELILSLAG